MKRNQQGFTLIELVVVIVILGILAAAALPRFIDLRSDAGTSAASGVAGALNSASNINWAASMARTTSGTGVIRVSAGIACSALAGSLLTGWDATPFLVTGTTPAGCSSAGQSVVCSISSTQTSSTPTTATLICTG